MAAEKAHNLKAAGSNLAPATKIITHINDLRPATKRDLLLSPRRVNNRSTKQRKIRHGAPTLGGHQASGCCQVFAGPVGENCGESGQQQSQIDL